MARIWIDIGSEEEEEELTDVHVGDPRDVVDRGVRARGVDALVGMDVASEHDVDSGVTQKRLPGKNRQTAEGQKFHLSQSGEIMGL